MVKEDFRVLFVGQSRVAGLEWDRESMENGICKNFDYFLKMYVCTRFLDKSKSTIRWIKFTILRNLKRSLLNNFFLSEFFLNDANNTQIWEIYKY